MAIYPLINNFCTGIWLMLISILIELFNHLQDIFKPNVFFQFLNQTITCISNKNKKIENLNQKIEY